MTFPRLGATARRLFAGLALSGAVLLGGCQNPDGSTNWGNTLLLGAGVGTAAALVAGAAADEPRRPPHYRRGHGRGPAYGYGYGPPRRHYW